MQYVAEFWVRLAMPAAARRAAAALVGATCIAIAFAAHTTHGAEQPAAKAATAPILQRHMDVSREEANKQPRSEDDQTLVEGWPLYRTERGQAAFNAAMATLKATDAPAPSAAAFKGCVRLECHVALPSIGSNGWIPAGRIWVSPSEYVLIAHSPRQADSQSYRRRSAKAMKVFVLHEFHNRTRNTDPYDTISSHKSRVFVPLYMTKEGIDARGRRFVIVVQVAPYDVIGIHATNFGSAGPGIEVASNTGEEMEPLQGLAGILVSTMVKSASPQLKVVNHRGSEGLAMLRAYEGRLELLKRRSDAARIVLPFVPAEPQLLATATARLDQLIARRGATPTVPIASSLLPPAPVLVEPIRLARRPATSVLEPRLIGPILPAVRPQPAGGGADR